MQDAAMRGPEGPIPVEIKNWADPIKPPFVKKTTIRTYVMDVNGKPIAICDFEPKRYRTLLIVVDQAVIITLDNPVASPDNTTASIAPQGGYLPPTPVPYEFWGPDAFYLNSVSGATATRVTVIKEYV